MIISFMSHYSLRLLHLLKTIALCINISNAWICICTYIRVLCYMCS